MDPINYSTDVQTPFQAALQGYQGGAAIRNDQFQAREQQIALAQQQQQMSVVRNLISNPNAGADDYANAALIVPGLKDQLKQSWDTKNTAQQQSLVNDLSQYSAAIQNGQPDLASQMMRDKATSMEGAAGGVTPQSQALRTQADIVDAHPDFANFMIKAKLAANPQGKQVVDNLASIGQEGRAQELQSPTVQKTQGEADISTANAENQPTKNVLGNADISSQIANRAGQLGLDQDKLTSDTQIRLAELARKPGAVDLPPSAQGIVNDSAQSSVISKQSANQLNDLANQFQTAAPGSGVLAKGWDLVKNATGQQDYVSNLRKEYNRLRTSQAIGSLKGVGRITDKEMSAAMGGFPSDTADPTQISTFLRGMAKMQNFSAQVDDAKSDWVSSVGSLAKTGKDIEVNGVHVPSGTTFQDYIGKTVKLPGASTQPVVSPGAKQRLFKTYGMPATPQAGGASGDY